MSDGIPSMIDAIRRPEYTGSNRCLPCTVVNSLIALIVSVLVTATISVAAGIVVLATSGTAIYLRGYLIPGTPRLTKRYLPNRIHRLFGTNHVKPEREGLAAAPDIDIERGDAGSGDTDAEEALQSNRVVAECPEADDLCLDPEFREAWRGRIATLREYENGIARLAAHLDADPDMLALEDRDREYVMTYQGDRVDGWLSRAAFLADLSVESTLAEWCSDWESYDPGLRTQIIASLRAFLERCPACDAELEAAESAWETCCREGTDVTISCNACGDVVFSGRY